MTRATEHAELVPLRRCVVHWQQHSNDGIEGDPVGIRDIQRAAPWHQTLAASAVAVNLPDTPEPAAEPRRVI